MIHGGELVTDGVEDHDQVVSSIDLVVELRDALGHVEQKLSTHRLEARSRKVVLQIPRVYLDRLADLLRHERISHEEDQIRMLSVVLWSSSSSIFGRKILRKLKLIMCRIATSSSFRAPDFSRGQSFSNRTTISGSRGRKSVSCCEYWRRR